MEKDQRGNAGMFGLKGQNAAKSRGKSRTRRRLEEGREGSGRAERSGRRVRGQKPAR